MVKRKAPVLKKWSKKKSSNKEWSKKASSSVLWKTATLESRRRVGRVSKHPKMGSNLWTPSFEEKGWKKRCKKSGKMCPVAVAGGCPGGCSLCYTKKQLPNLKDTRRCAQCKCSKIDGWRDPRCNGNRSPLVPTYSKTSAKLFAPAGRCYFPWPEYGIPPEVRCFTKDGSYQCSKAGTVNQEVEFKKLPGKTKRFAVGWVTASVIKWTECTTSRVEKQPKSKMQKAITKNRTQLRAELKKQKQLKKTVTKMRLQAKKIKRLHKRGSQKAAIKTAFLSGIKTVKTAIKTANRNIGTKRVGLASIVAMDTNSTDLGASRSDGIKVPAQMA